MARTISVDLSMTMTAAVPRPDLRSFSPSKSIGASAIICRRDQRDRRTAGNDGEQIVPAAADAAAVRVDQLAERQAHGFFHDAGLVHMAADLEQLGAFVLGPADGGEPGRAAAQDGGRNGDRFRHCSPWSGCHRGRRRRGTAASGAAGPSCLPGFRASRFLRRRYRRRHRGGRRHRNHSPSRRRSCRSGPAA